MTRSSGDRLLFAVAEVARQEQRELAAADIDDAIFSPPSDEELSTVARALEGALSSEAPASPTKPATERARARPGWRRRLTWLAAAAGVAGTSVALSHWVSSLPDPVTRPERPVEVDRRLALAEGSTLLLGEQSDVRVVTQTQGEVRVQLEHGSVECDVVQNPARRFVVAAGPFEVVVKGTRFTVAMEPNGAVAGSASTAKVAVSVERGLVEVRQAPDRALAQLGAGQRWESEAHGEPPVAAPPAGVALPASPAAPCPGCDGAPSRTPSTAQRHTAPRRVPRAPSAPPAPDPPDARRLFERANAAHLAGQAARAAEAFDELRRRHPTDARAGYAAFMLGRLRLDALGDAAGAVEPFSFAIAHPGAGFFLEDAEVRRIEALAKSRRIPECRAARDQFLARHAGSDREAFVAELCGGRGHTSP